MSGYGTRVSALTGGVAFGHVFGDYLTFWGVLAILVAGLAHMVVVEVYLDDV